MSVQDSTGAVTVIHAGKQEIEKSANNMIVSATQGSYYIYNEGSNVKITTGNGKDGIENYGSKVSISSGSGKDIIHNQTQSYWNDETEEWTVIGTPDNSIIDAGAGNDYILNSGGNSSTILGGEGSDTIENDGNNVLIDGGAGNDEVGNYGVANVSISGGAGNNEIVNFGGDYASINAGAGDDEIWNGDYYNRGGNNATLLGGAGDDFIRNEGNNSYLNGGDGDDYMLTGDYYISSVTAAQEQIHSPTATVTILCTAATEPMSLFISRTKAKILSWTTRAENCAKSRTRRLAMPFISSNTLTLTIDGGGSVIFKNVTSSTEFNINGTSYHVSGSTIK